MATWHWINDLGEPPWLMMGGRLSGCGGRVLVGQRFTFNTHHGETVAIYDSAFSGLIKSGPVQEIAQPGD